MPQKESDEKDRTGQAERSAPEVGLRTSDGYQFYIETPLHWDLPGPGTRVTGWCLAPKGEEIKDVRLVWARGEALGHYGGPRPDVAAAFNLPREFEACGFDISVVLPLGKTVLRLQVSDVAGHWHELATVTARVPWHFSFRSREKPVPSAPPLEKTQSEEEGSLLVEKYGIGGIRTEEGYHYFVDAPRNWSLADYRTKVVGWCVRPEGGKPTGMRVVWEEDEAFGRYGEPRPDVSHAFQLPKELETCGFKISVALPGGATRLSLQVCDQNGDWHELGKFTAKVPRYLLLPFWPRQRSKEDPADDYESWIDRYERPNFMQRIELRRRARALRYKPLFSVLLPTYNTPTKWLIAAIESVRRQSYPHWELCISDDASPEPAVRETLRRYARRDSRIKVTYREQNGHISASSNSALAMARGEFVALLDHDDEFSPSALYAVALELNRTPDLDLIYSDEDKIDEYGWRFDPYFKSDWNPDLLNGQNCVSHLGVFRTERLRETGGFREGVEGCQDWDVALRMTEGIPESQIRHIPRVLYHWRAIPGSTALALDEKNYIGRTGRKMLTEHFDRLKQKVEVTPVEGGHWRIKYALTSRPLVTIIIPTRNQVDLLRRCLTSVEALTQYENYQFLIVDNLSDEPESVGYLRELSRRGIRVLKYAKPFNYSAINNFAVAQAEGELICFLNNDMEAMTGEWLEEMVSHALRPEIGAVGGKLFFPDGTLQHTGIILGLGGPAGHILYKFNSNTGGYYNRARLVCNYSAVTAACMVLRKSVFLEAGGLDEEHLPVSYNDVDLCLRIERLGYRNLYTPFAQFYHHESASRGEDAARENYVRSRNEIEVMWQRWGSLLLHDPGYNPSLSLTRPDFSLAAPPRLRPIWQEEIETDPKEARPSEWPAPIEMTPVMEIGRTTTSAAEAVTLTFQRLLDRSPDPVSLLKYCDLLRGGATLQDIVAELARSREFRDSVANGSDSIEKAINVCFERILARSPDKTKIEGLSEMVARHDWETLATTLVYSSEFSNRFGMYTVPFSDRSPESRLTLKITDRPAEAEPTFLSKKS